MKLNWKSWTGVVAGASLSLLMVFANQFGLDNTPTWGGKRSLIFLIGVVVITVSLLYRKENFIGRVAHSPLFMAGLLSAGIITYYFWGVTIGTWRTWFHETSYYDLQATAFHGGQIALNIKPDPRLLEFKGFDVYEPENRAGIPILWDATLYHGNYYLYWGPAPALFLALIKFFYAEEVGDSVLTFAFLSGTFLFLVLLILALWKKHHAALPTWAALLAIAYAGLVNPMTYILFEPRIYEAAIIAAQFFLIGGTYFLLTAFDRPSAPRLALAGFFLTCAAASRTTLIPAIGFLALAALMWAVKTQRANAVKFSAAFAVPLLIGAMSYAAYNYTRFDSVLEFGLRYQITSYNLYKDLDKTFSLAYIPPNLYKNLFNPFELRDTFPYIFPTRWLGPRWLEEGYPTFYLLLAESITGIFVGSPFMFFAFVNVTRRKADESTRWILAALTGSALLSFFMLQAFFFTTMRYLLDLIPTLSLIAILGFWQGLDLLQHRRFEKFSYITLAGILFFYGLILSFALSISAHFEQIRAVNPEMLKEWTMMFNLFFK